MAIQAFEVALDNFAQKFSISLSGVTYNLTLVFNTMSDCWVLDIADINNVPLVCGIPLVTGHDLLEQFEYLGIGGGLLCLTDSTPEVVPTYDNLGTSGHLYYITQDETVAA